MIRRPAYELICSLIAIGVITLAYVLVARDGVPKPSGWLGHGLGIVGFGMMLATETLYSIRKRVPKFALGRMSVWLQVHVFTGIVGPYLVLLHSAGKFQGLAGVVTLLTIIMVLSGFTGRFIYTAVPRTLEGVELAVQEVEDKIAAGDRQLQALGLQRLRAAALARVGELPQHGWLLVFGRGWLRWRQRRRLHQAMHNLDAKDRVHAAEIEMLLAERYRLLLQIKSLAATRRLLALWHVVHIPLGVTLFSLAFLHIGAALYYATLSK